MEDECLREYIKDNWIAFLATCDLDQLLALREEFTDILIQTMPVIIRSQPGIRKRDRLKRHFMGMLAEKHGV